MYVSFGSIACHHLVDRDRFLLVIYLRMYVYVKKCILLFSSDELCNENLLIIASKMKLMVLFAAR